MEWMGRSGVELAKYVLAEKTRIPVENQLTALSQFWAGGVYGTNEVLAAMSLRTFLWGTISVRIEDAEQEIQHQRSGTGDPQPVSHVYEVRFLPVCGYSGFLDGLGRPGHRYAGQWGR